MTGRKDDWNARDDDLPPAVAAAMDRLAARHRGDPSMGRLRASVAGALPDDLDADAREALAGSPWLQATVDAANEAEADATLDAETQARMLARIHANGARARPRSSRWMLWSGLVAATALIITGITINRRVADEAGRSATAIAPPATASSSRAGATTFHLVLDAPAVKLTAIALTLRSDSRNARFVDAAAPALNAYRAGDYRTAAAAFEPLQTTYPSSVEVPFYLGVSRLWLNDAPGALQAFAAARRVDADTFRADVDWYVAIADERAGLLSAAHTELDALCRGTSAYAARACQAAPLFSR